MQYTTIIYVQIAPKAYLKTFQSIRQTKRLVFLSSMLTLFTNNNPNAFSVERGLVNVASTGD